MNDKIMGVNRMKSPKKLVLVVEDNPTNVVLLEDLLNKNGYEVGIASDANQAFEFINNKYPDLILLDVMMPGMNGFEICEELKSNIETRHIPIIFLTAKTATEDIVQGFKVGGVDYVTKPFKKEELLARVNTHIEIKTLRGLLPICASCKKVHNDEGYWQSIEEYFEGQNIAEFTTTFCDECAKKNYLEHEYTLKMRRKKEVLD